MSLHNQSEGKKHIQCFAGKTLTLKLKVELRSWAEVFLFSLKMELTESYTQILEVTTTTI